jgi:F0F1-type ATP synthase assembly protein I
VLGAEAHGAPAVRLRWYDTLDARRTDRPTKGKAMAQPDESRSPEDDPSDTEHSGVVGQWTALGLVFGTAFGLLFGQLLFENMGIGLALGMSIGLPLGVGIGVQRSHAAASEADAADDPADDDTAADDDSGTDDDPSGDDPGSAPGDVPDADPGR